MVSKLYEYAFTGAGVGGGQTSPFGGPPPSYDGATMRVSIEIFAGGSTGIDGGLCAFRAPKLVSSGA